MGTISRCGHNSGQDALELLPGNRVRFHRPLQIDLGGIAKGFAVDQAIAALRSDGASSGCVNAGGDLRVFGPTPSLIHVRHPLRPGETMPLVRLADAALATSAGYHSRKRRHGRWLTPLVDPRDGRPCTECVSVSVQAPSCLIADALTKVLMILGDASLPILRQHAATGFILSRDGGLVSSGTSHEA